MFTAGEADVCATAAEGCGVGAISVLSRRTIGVVISLRANEGFASISGGRASVRAMFAGAASAARASSAGAANARATGCAALVGADCSAASAIRRDGCTTVRLISMVAADSAGVARGEESFCVRAIAASRASMFCGDG